MAGGLRLTYYHEESSKADPPAARAGDRVEALVRARPVLNYGDPGSFDFRGYLARQNIQLQGSLRNGQLLTILGHPRLTLTERFARTRGYFLLALNDLFASRPDEGALARAMLLGDRSFVEHDRVVDFQKTGVYHVLVLAGLHVGALAAFFLWAGRRLRLALFPRILLTLVALAAYACIVEDRPPIDARRPDGRGVFVRKTDLPPNGSTQRGGHFRLGNSRRSTVGNYGRQFSFVVHRCRDDRSDCNSVDRAFERALSFGARSSFRRDTRRFSCAARDSISDRDASCCRMDCRALAAFCRHPSDRACWFVRLRAALYFWEIIFLSAVLQLGMLPPLAYYFHRVTLAGPLANVPALLLTGLAVPLGFFTLAASLVSRGLAAWLAKALGLILSLLDAAVRWFAGWHGASYRIPVPPPALIAAFAVAAIALSATVRMRVRLWTALAVAVALLAVAGVIATYPFSPRLPPQRSGVDCP